MRWLLSTRGKIMVTYYHLEPQTKFTDDKLNKQGNKFSQLKEEVLNYVQWNSHFDDCINLLLRHCNKTPSE